MFSDILKFNYHYFFDKPNGMRWYPIIAFYYLTYACGFRCYYCSDGKGRPYHTLQSEELDNGMLVKILSKIRKYCNYICLTGGEPFESKNLKTALTTIKLLNFKKLILTTNGVYFEENADILGQTVDCLVFSLDSMDPSKLSEWYGCSENISNKIIQSIELAHSIKKKTYRICISTVVTENNILDLYEVYKFAKSRNFEFAACPQLKGVTENQKLFHNPEYISFFNFLIREKKKNENIFGNIKYLEYMRDFTKFNCRPFTMLVLSPEGNVYYPCLEIGNCGGNLIEEESLHTLRKKANKLFGPQPVCSNQCHSACALNFALMLEKPQFAVKEVFRNIKNQITKKN